MKNKKMMMAFAITLMVIGFASVSTVLYLNGQTFVASNTKDFDVYYSKAVENGTENSSIIKDKTHIAFTTELTGLNDTYVLDYDVTNGSKQYDANLVMNCTGGNEYLRVENKFDTTEILPARQTRSGRLILTVIKAVTEETSVNISCEISGNAVERDTAGGNAIEKEPVDGYLAQAYDKDLTVTIREEVDLHGLEPLEYRFIEETYGSYENYDSQFQEKCSGDYNNESEACVAFLSENDRNMENYGELKIYGEVGKFDELFNAACPNGGGDTSDSCNSFRTEHYQKVNIKISEIYRQYYQKIVGGYLWAGLDKFYPVPISVNNLTKPSIQFLENSIYTITNKDISSITFETTNEVPSNAICSWDASEQQNGSIMAWIVAGENRKYEIYIGQDGGVKANPNSSMLFYLFWNTTSINGLENLDTSNVTNMSSMFDSCKNLTNLNLSSFNTSSVKDMHNMFLDCGKLTNLDVSNWDTSNVSNMSYMFEGCHELATLDLSSFDISQVIDMERMFFNCSNLTTTITIRGTNCKNYNDMFQGAAYDSNGAQITVNYTADASDLVDKMLETKYEWYNVVKGSVVS